MSHTILQSPLLSLPLELRLAIYDYALSAPTAISITTTIVDDTDAQVVAEQKESIPGLPRNHVPHLCYYTDAASTRTVSTLEPDNSKTPPGLSQSKHHIDHSSDSDEGPRPRKRARRAPPGTGQDETQTPYLPYLAFGLFQVNRQINQELTRHLTKRRIQDVATSFSFSHSADAASHSAASESQRSASTGTTDESPTSSRCSSPDSRSSYSYESPIVSSDTGIRLHVTYPYGILILKHKYPDLITQAREISITGYHVTHAIQATTRPTSSCPRSIIRPPMSKETWDAAKTALAEITRKVLSPKPSPLLKTLNLRFLIPGESSYREMWEDGSPVGIVLYNTCGGNINMMISRGSIGSALIMSVRPLPRSRSLSSRHGSFNPDDDWTKLDSPARFEEQSLAFSI
ncbi:hypothetical protein EJ05DRAFT_111955 [Pseudovirgaria hyperparasitica]|uniref:Uncharacterized protein n=1 Tax=Pseudovirgaria hyperparasitica TaxID=470096 RepID=A0A6A6VYH0_9PEZI|nr:uncharacterized protein EJ05DRAFT_111955 [Pseudovirgaria hyperparasitica]KAF2755682.1 hypothetical protein EJ05DRAFT_111955 [Pseudovirgaria hyperparasitica]